MKNKIINNLIKIIINKILQINFSLFIKIYYIIIINEKYNNNKRLYKNKY